MSRRKDEQADIKDIEVLTDGTIFSVTITVTRDDGSSEDFVVVT